MNEGALLSMRSIRKGFPGVLALDDVDFDVRPGEIHALMGENGAGKSTLIKVMTGVHRSDRGTMTLADKPFQPASPADAVTRGVSTVYQEVNLVPNLSVAENVCLGHLRGVPWGEMRRRAQAALRRLGIELDVRTPLGSHSIAIQQMVAIARALDVEAKVLVLDEPTSSLDAGEVAALFAILRKLREDGLAIVFITHFLDQVFEIADTITVLRNGRLVATRTAKALSRLELVSQMLGRDAAELGAAARAPSAGRGSELMRANGMGRRGGVQGLTFSIARGEVVGLAGLLGSGRTETLRLLFGLDAPTEGSLELEGVQRRLSARLAIRLGIGLTPEDRKAEALLPGLTIRENLMLVLQARRGWLRRLSRREQQQWIDTLRARLHIAMREGDAAIDTLSGGNQQKIVLARWLAADPKLLLLDEPTRGIDVGAKFEIEGLIEELRAKGMALVVVSSELDELVRTCSHVVVLRDRRMVDELQGQAIDEARLVAAIAKEGS
ncbi:MAG: sugar ABC transporter ATP-binding protein [Fimbriimonadaceae bacterium]|nr:sugar ABC transporter ATP-binding protein [Fimbriimonadaceae bacterium]